MKLKFEKCYRGFLMVLVLCAACSLWAAAQTNTNVIPKADAETNHAITQEVRKLDQRYLTFGLDRLPILRELQFLGEPLWKYAASLIYIFLAFYIAKLFDLIVFVWLKKFAAKT